VRRGGTQGILQEEKRGSAYQIEKTACCYPQKGEIAKKAPRRESHGKGTSGTEGDGVLSNQ